jgi:hypothetical protein
MSANDDLERTADQIKALLGAPPLMRGESEEDYWKWWLAFAEEHEPKRLSDWLEVNELAQRHWEQRRLRRYGPALVEGALVEALTDLLRPLHIGGIPLKVAHDYFGNDAKAKQRARETVTTYGITEEQIVAEAMQKRGSALLVLDRMDNHRANASRLLRKEIDRRSESRRIPPDQADNQQ